MPQYLLFKLLLISLAGINGAMRNRFVEWILRELAIESYGRSK
jgi:hypothetical protein